MIITDKSYNAYKYHSIWKITAWKDECIYKTEFLGYIKSDDTRFDDTKKFTKSSLSTSLTRGGKEKFFTIKLL